MSSRRATVGQPAPIPVSELPFVRDYRVRFLTPVFGGGVVAKDGSQKPYDPVTVVRSASIRGHLRFWWRATSGCYSRSVEEMRKAEMEIWGGPERAGKVAVAVTRQPSQPAPVQTYSHPNGGNARSVLVLNQDLSYVTFPLQGERGGPSGELWDFGEERFTVRLSAVQLLSDSQQQQVELALHAWLVWGGLGARTRRGFGAVEGYLVLGNAESRLTLPRLEDMLQRVQTTAEAAGIRALQTVPHLDPNRAWLQRSVKQTSAAAWASGVKALRDFRQGLNLGRNAEGNAPKRSRWPEADMIRRLTRQRSAAHHEDISHANVAARAGFGMPMIIKFKDDRQGDPAQVQILPASTRKNGLAPDRLASPFLIRPIRDGESQFVAVCTRLQYAVPIDKVRVVQGSRTWEVAGKFGDAHEVSRDRAHPLIPVGADGAVAQSFFVHFSKF
jgi:CRISPR-associated protein Cmr1